MTAKEYLRQYEYATRKVKRLEVELEEETLLIDAVRSVSDNDGMPHGNGINKPTEERAIRLADKRLRLVQARLDAIQIRQEIYDAIESVGGFESEVLFERHVRLDPDGSQQTWETICNKLYYSWPTVRLAYNAGLEKIDEYLQE